MIDQRAEYIAGMMEFLNVLAENPDIPIPLVKNENLFASSAPALAKVQVAAFIARAPRIEKVDDDEYIKLVRQFAGLSVSLYVRKDTLGCKKVPVTRPVTTEEWQCGPLLDAIGKVPTE